MANHFFFLRDSTTRPSATPVRKVRAKLIFLLGSRLTAAGFRCVILCSESRCIDRDENVILILKGALARVGAAKKSGVLKTTSE